MKKAEILKLCKNYYIAVGDEAISLSREDEGLLIMPALIGYENDGATYVLSESDGTLNVSFFGAEGGNLDTVSSKYAEGDYIYVREAYWKDNEKVRFFADFVPGEGFLRNKVMPARFMPKSAARTFLKIKDVFLRRLKHLDMIALKKMGFSKFDDLFARYDEKLSEREYEFSRSELNPYVFVYEYEKVDLYD